MSDSLSFPFQAHIPYRVLADTTLCPNAKIHFGCLSGLAEKEGYCWATNEQLAGMHGVAVIQIKKWLDQLEDSGFIRRETTNRSYRDETGKLLWKKRRRIYIGDAYSRKSSDRYENEPSANNFKDFTEMGEETKEADKKTEANGPPPDLENSKKGYDRYEKSPIDDRYEKSPINSKSLREEKEQQPGPASPGPEKPPTAGVCFSSLDELELTRSQKLSITKEHSEAAVNLAVSRVLKWKSRTSDIAALLHVLKNPDKWTDPKTTNPEETTEFLTTLTNLDGKTVQGTQIVVGPNYIEFNRYPKMERFDVSIRNFIEIVKQKLETLRVKYA